MVCGEMSKKLGGSLGFMNQQTQLGGDRLNEIYLWGYWDLMQGEVPR